MEPRNVRPGNVALVFAAAAALIFACGGATSGVGSAEDGGTGGAHPGRATPPPSAAAAPPTAPTPGAGDAGPTAPDAGPSVPGPYDQCAVTSDCAWGEIDREIRSPSDCMCLFGCPYIPQSKTTATRRKAQYATFCVPGMDGAGRPCAVDDCAGPPPIECIRQDSARPGTCAAARLLDAGAR